MKYSGQAAKYSGQAAWLALFLVWGGCASALPPAPAHVAGEEPGDPEQLYADIKKILKDIKTEKSAQKREAMAVQAVKLGQRCDQAAPGHPLCDYGLALALGTQARERPATAHDGLPLMAKRLQHAAEKDPVLDHAGPERVLGLLQVRAPGWPTGPGDPESGLENARKAASREPDYAPNWLALAEAADVNGDAKVRRDAAKNAVALAERAAQAGDPDAASWRSDAQKLLQK
jgi:hypothetical protein